MCISIISQTQDKAARNRGCELDSTKLPQNFKTGKPRSVLFRNPCAGKNKRKENPRED